MFAVNISVNSVNIFFFLIICNLHRDRVRNFIRCIKGKYKTAIDKGTLTDSQAEQLLKAKFAFDIKEAGIRQKYMPKLATAIPYKKVYYCFDFINDKMSKIEGRKSSQDDED